ncbi:hypothetical protein ACFQMH_40365 [Streptomyces viridiviolaceus]|uniref:Lipoprotein n=1 Tax=Streptomyces viridiviolaceus TaxID=68282 RepID=A0ABW2EES8_9ACTN|nr:hypothetical protein [Streptomyces viridiviolaceus]
MPTARTPRRPAHHERALPGLLLATLGLLVGCAAPGHRVELGPEDTVKAAQRILTVKTR